MIGITDSGEVERSSERSDDWSASHLHRSRTGRSGRARGVFVWSLVLTDIASGWTECVPLLVREARLVVDALDHLRGALPFPLRGIDTDNGSEFLNEVLVAFCREQGIELTRSRPYRKNDQAWVEQKNGAVVRRMVGYGRLEGVPAAEALARLYSGGSLFYPVQAFVDRLDLAFEACLRCC